MGPHREPVGLSHLLPECLYHPDSGDALLGRLGDVGLLLLHVNEHRMGAAARSDGHQGQCGPHEQRQNSERHIDKQQHHSDKDQREQVHEQKDEAVAKEEAHGLQVAGGPRHQLAHRHAVEVPEREALQMRKHEAAQVELHREAHASRHDAAHEREDRPDDTDHDHADNQGEQCILLLAVQDVVNYPPGDVRQCDRAAHQCQRGNGRNGDRPLVWPEKCEQPEKRAQKRPRWVVM